MLCATISVLIVSVLAAEVSRQEAESAVSLNQHSQGQIGDLIDDDVYYYYPPCNDYDPCFGEKAAEYEKLVYAVQMQVCEALETSEYYDAKPDCDLQRLALAFLRNKSDSRIAKECTLKLEGSYPINGSTNEEKMSRTLKLGSDRILETIERCGPTIFGCGITRLGYADDAMKAVNALCIFSEKLEFINAEYARTQKTQNFLHVFAVLKTWKLSILIVSINKFQTLSSDKFSPFPVNLLIVIKLVFLSVSLAVRTS